MQRWCPARLSTSVCSSTETGRSEGPDGGEKNKLKMVMNSWESHVNDLPASKKLGVGLLSVMVICVKLRFRLRRAWLSALLKSVHVVIYLL